MEDWKAAAFSSEDLEVPDFVVNPVLPDLIKPVGSAAPSAGGTQTSPNPGSSSGNNSDGSSSGSNSGSHSSGGSGGTGSASGTHFVEINPDVESGTETQAPAAEAPASEIVQITIFDNFVDPAQTASVTAAALPTGPAEAEGLSWALPAIGLAIALVIGLVLRKRAKA